MSNEPQAINRYWNLKCPQCGNQDSFQVTCTSVCQVWKDGQVYTGAPEWQAGSACKCPDCHFAGVLEDFFAKDSLG